MRHKRRKIFEKAIETVLFSSSTLTSIAVILIVVFLFSEGIGLFTAPAVEKGYVIALNKANPIQKLSNEQLFKIFNQDYTNWARVGSTPDTILLLRYDDISTYFTEEELGPEFENLPRKVDSLLQANPNMIAFIPAKYAGKNFGGKVLQAGNVSIKEFITESDWYPTSQPMARFGVLPLILGTLWVSFGAILIALPLGLATAIYMAEVSGKRFRNILKPVIELLAGIPSVVYGFFGLIIVVPAIQKIFHLPVGESGLAGSIILGIMALPTIITIAEDAIRTTPVSLREASLALGATRWQTMQRVVIPYSMSGITAGAILGIGRAIGETMAVLMVTGNASVIPHSFLQPMRTIPATIAAELGEAPYGGTHFKALFALGIILFIITLCINVSVEYIKNKRKI